MFAFCLDTHSVSRKWVLLSANVFSRKLCLQDATFYPLASLQTYAERNRDWSKRLLQSSMQLFLPDVLLNMQLWIKKTGLLMYLVWIEIPIADKIRHWMKLKHDVPISCSCDRRCLISYTTCVWRSAFQGVDAVSVFQFSVQIPEHYLAL